MKKRSFLENTSYSSIILILTKMIGVIPVFFMEKLLGSNGLAAFGATYAFAVVALELAAGGIPLGVSQFVSKSNAVGDYKTSDQALRLMLIATGILSTIIGIVFFLIAPFLAGFLPQGIQGMTTFSIRMFIPTIIMAPVVGVVRGFYNGNKDTVPSSFSQLIEQTVWIFATFIFVFLANIVSKNNEGLKSGLAIFANFVAILAAALILYRYWEEHHEFWDNQIVEQTRIRHFTWQQILITILITALPTVLVSLMMNSFQFLTNFFYNPILQGKYTEELVTSSFKTLQFNSAKFVSIPLVIANTIAFSTLPFMASAFRKRDIQGVKSQIKQSLLLSYIIVMFAAFAIWVFGPMLYHGLFFSSSARNMSTHVLSTQIIRIDGFRGLFMGIATLMNVILVTMNERWKTVKFVGIGIVVKLIATPVLLFLAGPIGDILASDVAYITIIVLSFNTILQYVKFPKRFYKQFIIIFVVNLIVALMMYILIRLIGYQFTKTNRLLTIAEVIVIGILGMGVYGYILKRLNVLKYMFRKKV